MSLLTRLWPSTRHGWLLLIGVALAALIAFLPLRLALALAGAGESGLSARSASGTIWSGRLVEARLGSIDLGTFDVGLHPLPVLTGRARVGFTRLDSPAAPLSGTAETGLGGWALRDVTGTSIGGDFGDLPVERIITEQMTVSFSGNRCTTASGRVRLLLGTQIAGLALRNGLSGNARCDGGALLLPLVGDSGIERLTIRVTGDGRYTGQLGVNSADPLVAAALAAAGFGPRGGGYRRSFAGRF